MAGERLPCLPEIIIFPIWRRYERELLSILLSVPKSFLVMEIFYCYNWTYYSFDNIACFIHCKRKGPGDEGKPRDDNHPSLNPGGRGNVAMAWSTALCFWSERYIWIGRWEVQSSTSGSGKWQLEEAAASVERWCQRTLLFTLVCSERWVKALKVAGMCGLKTTNELRYPQAEHWCGLPE